MVIRKVILIGTSHKYQYLNGGTDAKNVEKFKDFVGWICLKYEAKAIAEEMSDDALKEFNVSESTAQKLCREIGLKHQLSEPSLELRAQLGIQGPNDIKLKGFYEDWEEQRIEAEIRKSFEKKERYWFEQICVLNIWPVVFICGANHCDSFTTLLQTN